MTAIRMPEAASADASTRTTAAHAISGEVSRMPFAAASPKQRQPASR